MHEDLIFGTVTTEGVFSCDIVSTTVKVYASHILGMRNFRKIELSPDVFELTSAGIMSYHSRNQDLRLPYGTSVV